MTIGFRSNLVVNFEKKDNFFWSVKFCYVCFTGKNENLEGMPGLKDIFKFLANGHHFQKCSFLVETLTFLKEVSSVFEKCQILVVCFLLVKNVCYAKSVTFLLK